MVVGFKGEKDLVPIERHTKCLGSTEKSVSQGNMAPSRCCETWVLKDEQEVAKPRRRQRVFRAEGMVVGRGWIRYLGVRRSYVHAFLSARVEGVEHSVERQAGVGGGGGNLTVRVLLKC